MCLLGGKIVFLKNVIFFLKLKRFGKKTLFLKIYIFFFPANCFKNLLLFLKKIEKTQKTDFFLPSTRQKREGSNQVFFFRFFFFVLKQNCFRKILQFIINFCYFFNFEPSLFSKSLIDTFGFFFNPVVIFFPYAQSNVLHLASNYCQ